MVITDRVRAKKSSLSGPHALKTSWPPCTTSVTWKFACPASETPQGNKITAFAAPSNSSSSPKPNKIQIPNVSSFILGLEIALFQVISKFDSLPSLIARNSLSWTWLGVGRPWVVPEMTASLAVTVIRESLREEPFVSYKKYGWREGKLLDVISWHFSILLGHSTWNGLKPFLSSLFLLSSFKKVN